MKSRDLYLSMVGIDDNILAKASRYSEKRKIIKFNKRLSFVACICMILLATATAAAAIHHFWGRGMSGMLRSTDAQQQELTEQGQAIVYPELEDYSSYQVTDQGITIAPDTVVVDDRFAYVSFKVSGFEITEHEEPGADVDYYLGDDKESMNSWVNGSSYFFDGTMIDDNGMAIYTDGSPLESDENGFFGHYLDENGDLEYVIQIQAVDGLSEILGNTLHVDFTALGVYGGKTEFSSQVDGNWSFELELPKVSSSQTITVNKDIPDTDCTLTSIDISPVSISVTYKINGVEQQSKDVKGLSEAVGGVIDGVTGENVQDDDITGLPTVSGFVLKDGTRMPYVADAGSDGYTDDSREYGVCTRGFDRVVDISQIKSILFWPDDSGNHDLVEVEIQ